MIVQTQPYLHFIQYHVFSREEQVCLYNNLSLLEWERYDKQGYKYDVSSLDFDSPYLSATFKVLKVFLNASYLEKLALLFETPLEKCCNVTFHRLLPTDFSLKHNDDNPYGEKVRLVYYLSENTEYEGGEFYLYSGAGQNIPYYTHKLPSNAMFGFKMTHNSFHEVAMVTAGTRICLVITYK